MNYEKQAHDLVRDFVSNTIDKSQYPNGLEFEVVTVWSCYILGNEKYLITTSLPDTRYYEITYNSVKKEFYFDAYSRVFNFCKSLESLQ